MEIRISISSNTVWTFSAKFGIACNCGKSITGSGIELSGIITFKFSYMLTIFICLWSKVTVKKFNVKFR